MRQIFQHVAFITRFVEDMPTTAVQLAHSTKSSEVTISPVCGQSPFWPPVKKMFKQEFVQVEFEFQMLQESRENTPTEIPRWRGVV